MIQATTQQKPFRVQTNVPKGRVVEVFPDLQQGQQQQVQLRLTVDGVDSTPAAGVALSAGAAAAAGEEFARALALLGLGRH